MSIKSIIISGSIISLFFLLSPFAQAASTLTVCATGTAGQNGCQYIGGDGIQQAVDTAQDGDTILIKDGAYTNVAIQIGEDSHPTKQGIKISGESHNAVLDGGKKGDVIHIGEDSNITIENLTIKNAMFYGITVSFNSRATITNNHVTQNDVTGIFLHNQSTATITNNTITQNGYNGIDCGGDSECGVINNIVVSNGWIGIIGASTDSFISLRNNLSWNNSNRNFNDFNTNQELTNWGNLQVDPQFISATDFHLQPGSPAIDAGDPSINDADGTRSDIGMFGGLNACPAGDCSHLVFEPIPLPNSSFELGTFSGWSLHGLDATQSFVVNCGAFPPCSDGQHYAKLVRVLGDQDPHLASEWIETGQNLSGKQMKVSFAIKAHNANASIRGIAIQREPKDNNWAQTTAGLPEVVEATANWQTKTYTVNLPTPTDGNTSTRFRVVLRPEKSLSYQLPVYYDNVQVELVTSGETTLTPTPPVTPTLPPSTSIFGDTNSDDKVDILDILNHIKNFGKNLTQGIDPLETNLNNDDQVNIFDYVFSLRDFGLSQLHFPGPEASNHIRARGTQVDGIYPTFQLLNRFNHVILEQTVTENWTDYPFTLTLRDTIMTGYKIKFINDKGDRNLQIDYLHLHGQKLETEAETTYSTGTWNSTDSACVPGYVQSEYLHCNGYVEYLVEDTPTPTSIVPSIIP